MLDEEQLCSGRGRREVSDKGGKKKRERREENK